MIPMRGYGRILERKSEFETADALKSRQVNEEVPHLDTEIYNNGALDRKTKELLGLVASTVLICDDCINYHLNTCMEMGVTDQELTEAMDIALVVRGSINIPHIRRAYRSW